MKRLGRVASGSGAGSPRPCCSASWALWRCSRFGGSKVARWSRWLLAFDWASPSPKPSGLLGGPPDEILPWSGVVVDGVTLIDAGNSDVAKYGSPSNFEMRRWDRGDMSAAVVISEEGQVAGHSTFRHSAGRYFDLFWSKALP